MASALETIPPDDPKRSLTVAQPDNLPHIGLVGDTYTITVTGEQTAGVSASSTCTSRPVAVRPRTGMTSRRPSSFLRARWKPRSAARSLPSALAKP